MKTNIFSRKQSSKTNTTKPITSPKANDGIFIGDDDMTDGFSSRGTVRYGEETDVDDL